MVAGPCNPLVRLAKWTGTYLQRTDLLATGRHFGFPLPNAQPQPGDGKNLVGPGQGNSCQQCSSSTLHGLKLKGRWHQCGTDTVTVLE